MGALADKALADLNEAASKQTNATKDLVTKLAADLENAVRERDAMRRELRTAAVRIELPFYLYGKITSVDYGMDKSSFTARLILNAALDDKVFPGLSVRKLYSISTLQRLVLTSEVPSMSNLVGCWVRFGGDEEIKLIDEAPLGYLGDGTGLFQGVRVKYDEDEQYSGVIVGASENGERNYVTLRRDDGITGGGNDGEWIANARYLQLA